MSTLKNSLSQLAERFATDVLATLQKASLSELTGNLGKGESPRTATAFAAPAAPAKRGRPAGSKSAKAAPAPKAAAPKTSSLGVAPAKAASKAAPVAAAKAAPAPAAKAPAKSAGKSSPAALQKSGRLARRTVDDIVKTQASIVALLAGAKAGLRAEDIRTQLGLHKKELPRPLADALAANEITKKGQKRATMYFASTGKSGKGKK